MDSSIKELLDKPLWQMTGKEFQTLLWDSINGTHPVSRQIHLTGVKKLAEYLECCESTVYMLRRNGILEDAVVSHVGKKIVFDGEKARALADEYQKQQRDKK